VVDVQRRQPSDDFRRTRHAEIVRREVNSQVEAVGFLDLPQPFPDQPRAVEMKDITVRRQRKKIEDVAGRRQRASIAKLLVEEPLEDRVTHGIHRLALSRFVGAGIPLVQRFRSLVPRGCSVAVQVHPATAALAVARCRRGGGCPSSK
jgi:hypothetical protein